MNSLRQRQMRNMLTALLVAHGVPMLYMGDEYGHRCEGWVGRAGWGRRQGPGTACTAVLLVMLRPC